MSAKRDILLAQLLVAVTEHEEWWEHTHMSSGPEDTAKQHFEKDKRLYDRAKHIREELDAEMERCLP